MLQHLRQEHQNSLQKGNGTLTKNPVLQSNLHVSGQTVFSMLPGLCLVRNGVLSQIRLCAC